jgi:hypothetical protein
MRRTVAVIRKGFLYICTLVLVAGYPTVAMATPQEPATEQVLITPSNSLEEKSEEEKPLTYTYDPVDKKWNSEEWQFNSESGKYEKPTAPVIIEPDVETKSVLPQSPDNPISQTVEESSEKTSETSVTIDTKVLSEAISGDAFVGNNTNAGSALSGDATAVANIINAVNSSISSGENQKIATFTKDITGDVKGDIILYPMLLKAMLEAKAGAPATAINNSTDLQVNNDITLNAKSGNATVDSNTNAGDATTGNAVAMANVVNILNSLISTQESFIGTINIYGSLEGDILIAPDFIPQMIASNGGESGTKLSKQDTTTIVNNITAVAESGAAEVFGNTSAGSATTGNAESNVVIFNVTGHDIVAENSLLVFVNVLGKWVGMIIDAPQGATAAMIGSGVISSELYAPDVVVESQSKHGITNTIAVNAQTGDAVVSNNTNAGNATSGDASAIANVANISNSSLSLAGWLLFINITGDWFGSFQIDTPYGNMPTESESPQPKPSGPVQFVPKNNTEVKTMSTNTLRTVIDSRFTRSSSVITEHVEVESVENINSQDDSDQPEVKSAVTDTTEETPALTNEDGSFFLIVAGSIIVLGISVLGIRRFF